MNWTQFLGSAPQRPFSLERFFRWRCYWDYSGGLATDLFVHLVSSIHAIMDVKMPERVVASGATYRWKTHEVPDTIDAILTYPEQFTATLSCTLNSEAGGESGLAILGTKGTLKFGNGGLEFVAEAAPREQPLGGQILAEGARRRVLRRPEDPGARDARHLASEGDGRPASAGRSSARTRPSRTSAPSSTRCSSRSSRSKMPASVIAPHRART